MQAKEGATQGGDIQAMGGYQSKQKEDVQDSGVKTNTQRYDVQSWWGCEGGCANRKKCACIEVLGNMQLI